MSMHACMYVCKYACMYEFMYITGCFCTLNLREPRTMQLIWKDYLLVRFSLHFNQFIIIGMYICMKNESQMSDPFPKQIAEFENKSLDFLKE